MLAKRFCSTTQSLLPSSKENSNRPSKLLEDNRLQTYRAFRSEIDDAGAADSGESRTVDASSGVG